MPPITPVEIIAAARKLLAEGQFEEARTLLLEQGYMRRLQPAVQTAYLELIPPGVILLEMLSTLYRGLDDPRPAVRRKTITSISAELSKEVLRGNVRWMQDPRASDPIMKAVSDPDPMVRERALGALMRLVWRFFPDLRCAPAFIAHLNSKKFLTRYNAIYGIGYLRNETLLENLVAPFESGSEDDRALVVAQIGHLSAETPYHKNLPTIEWSEAGRSFWRAKMAAGLKDPSVKIRQQVAVVLHHLGDRTSVAALKAALADESDVDARYAMSEALAAIEARG